MDKASDILKRVRRIELRAKHLATENFAGQYQSASAARDWTLTTSGNTCRGTIPVSSTGR